MEKDRRHEQCEEIKQTGNVESLRIGGTLSGCKREQRPCASEKGQAGKEVGLSALSPFEEHEGREDSTGEKSEKRGTGVKG